MSRNSISFIGRAAHRHNNSLSRVRMSRINRQRQSRLENPLMTPLHETERIALMNAVARIFVERHGTSQDFADAKVLEMTEADLATRHARHVCTYPCEPCCEKDSEYSMELHATQPKKDWPTVKENYDR